MYGGDDDVHTQRRAERGSQLSADYDYGGYRTECSSIGDQHRAGRRGRYVDPGNNTATDPTLIAARVVATKIPTLWGPVLAVLLLLIAAIGAASLQRGGQGIGRYSDRGPIKLRLKARAGSEWRLTEVSAATLDRRELAGSSPPISTLLCPVREVQQPFGACSSTSE